MIKKIPVPYMFCHPTFTCLEATIEQSIHDVHMYQYLYSPNIDRNLLQAAQQLAASCSFTNCGVVNSIYNDVSKKKETSSARTRQNVHERSATENVTISADSEDLMAAESYPTKSTSYCGATYFCLLNEIQ